MPAIATGPISFVETDEDGKVVKDAKTITFTKGDYIADEIVAQIAHAHSHSYTTVLHVDSICPIECEHESHGGRHLPVAEVDAPVEVPAPPAPPQRPTSDKMLTGTSEEKS